MQNATSFQFAIAPTRVAANPDSTGFHSEMATASAAEGTATSGVVLSGSLVIAIPTILVLGILCYRRYRAASRQRQIRMLERLWLLQATERHR